MGIITTEGAVPRAYHTFGGASLKERFISFRPFSLHMFCDVLVVGASPSGIMAAISAAELDAQVILIDKDLGSFDHPANTFLDGMLNRAGLAADECYIQHRLSGMRILSPYNHHIEIPARGCSIDRKKFDDHHLRRAEGVGVALQRGEVFSTDLYEGWRSVKTSLGEIRAGVVIDAGGVMSTIGKDAGLMPLRHPEDVAWAFEAVIEHPGIGEEEMFEYWIGSMAPGWKATYSPCGGDLAKLGVFVRGTRDVRAFFEKFLDRFKKYKSTSYEDIDSLKIRDLRRGGDPIATIPNEIVSDSMMVTGGAAGQSGLAYSMRAGAICGRVAAEAIIARDMSKQYLSRYQRRWSHEFSMEYRAGRACLETLRRLSDEDIDALIVSLSRRRIISPGSFYKKAFRAGLALTFARPTVILAILKNLIAG